MLTTMASTVSWQPKRKQTNKVWNTQNTKYKSLHTA